MECVALDIEGFHLRVTDLDTLRVVACIKLASHRQASPGRGGGNQFDHRFAADQELAPAKAGGLPRQVWVMWQNSRCSILFHFEVPGG